MQWKKSHARAHTQTHSQILYMCISVCAERSGKGCVALEAVHVERAGSKHQLSVCHTVWCALSIAALLYPAVYVRIAAASGAVCGNRLPRLLNSNPTKLILFFSSHPQSYTHMHNCTTQILHHRQRSALEIHRDNPDTVKAGF